MSNSKNDKFIKVIRHVYNNIDQPMKLKELAEIANLSVSSLKLLFVETIGESPGKFIRRLRMEFAFQSIQSNKDSVLEAALSAGFEDQSAFGRRFKETFGYSPKHARKKINIVSELESVSLQEPNIIELNDIVLRSVTEKGLYFEAAPKAFQKLKEKILADNQGDDECLAMFIGVGHDNPHEGKVKEDEVRFTAGVALLEREIDSEKMTLSGGRYARFSYFGKPNNMGLAYHYIYGKWADTSNLVIDHQKCAFMEFETFPEPTQEQNILIYVPI